MYFKKVSLVKVCHPYILKIWVKQGQGEMRATFYQLYLVLTKFQPKAVRKSDASFQHCQNDP